MLTYELGQFTFHGMWGAPRYVKNIIAGEVRPGVDGTSLFDLGKWGRPFQMETIKFVESWSAAIDLCQAYDSTTAEDPLTLTNGNVVIPGHKYKVLDTDAIPKRIIRGAVAGDGTNYQAEVRCLWSLLPIEDF